MGTVIALGLFVRNGAEPVTLITLSRDLSHSLVQSQQYKLLV